MRIESIKNVNITALFSAPLNHLLISQEGVLRLFKTENQENDKHTFVEAPGLKVLAFPNLKKEIVFEGVRVLVNDKSETLPENSNVADDFQKIINGNMVEQDKIVAYGFNYDVVVLPENDSFEIGDLVGTKITNLTDIDIKSAGVNILFDKGNITYVLEVKPIGNEHKFIVHFNAHFSTNKLPDNIKLKEELSTQFEEMKKIIEKI